MRSPFKHVHRKIITVFHVVFGARKQADVMVLHCAIITEFPCTVFGARKPTDVMHLHCTIITLFSCTEFGARKQLMSCSYSVQ